MAPPDPVPWSDRVAAVLRGYDEALLRKVAGRLVRPRNLWPIDELIRRSLDVLDNPVLLDRRLGELAPPGRQLLALLGISRQPWWHLGNLVELVMALGHGDGLAAVLDLLEAGLAFPVLPGADDGRRRLTGFDSWLGSAAAGGSLIVFSIPQVIRRATGVDLGLPDLAAASSAAEEPTFTAPSVAPLEADGLEWLLRLGVLWQQVLASPLRRTQQGGLFKRDVERLEQDPLLNAAPPDHLTDVPDLGFWLAALAEGQGLLRGGDGEVRAETIPAVWELGLWPAIESLWADLFRATPWTPLDGWRDEERVGNPFPSAYLLLFALLGRCSPEAWLAPSALQEWLQTHHPYWTNESVRPSRQQPWVATFLLGLGYPLRLVQVRQASDTEPLVRLSPAGRWLLGQAEMPPPPAVFPRTLLVQPNLEILAYRQGLTPALVARLSRIATWKTLGPACTLQLEPETVYRALELGETFDSVCRLLEQHGTRTTPPAVLDLLRTWANKRDRITVFPTAALLEFNRPEDLSEALARGLPAMRLTDTLAVVASEEQIEFRHFRLAGTRDYALPPERCVTVEADGVTLTVDLVRSDLMLETELPRFAEPVDRVGLNGKRQYRLTPASLARGREAGMTLAQLETWFQQRIGQPVTPAARLLLTGAVLPPPLLRRHLVLHVEVPEIADGLLQWPGSEALIAERLGPTSLSVAEENLPLLRQRLSELGVTVTEEG